MRIHVAKDRRDWVKDAMKLKKAGKQTAKLNWHHTDTHGGDWRQSIATYIPTGDKKITGGQAQLYFSRAFAKIRFDNRGTPFKICTKLKIRVPKTGKEIWLRGGWSRSAQMILYDMNRMYTDQGEEMVQDISELLASGEVLGITFVAQPQGIGADKKNDCLLYALDKAVTHKPYKHGYIKRELNIGRRDPIPRSRIPELEDIYRIRINVVGERPSTAEYKRHITVVLANGHCFPTSEAEEDGYITPLLKMPKWRKLVVAKRQSSGKWRTKSEELEKLVPYTDICFKLPNVKGVCLWKCGSQSIDKTFERLTAVNEFLAKQSPMLSLTSCDAEHDWLINHWRTFLTQKIRKCNIEEEKFLRTSMRGGFVYCKPKGIYKHVFEMDVKSHYPTVMLNPTRKWATGAGTIVWDATPFKAVQKLHETEPTFSTRAKIQYGIYSAHVEVENSVCQEAGVAPHRDDRYTHIDIKRLLQQGVPFTFLDDAPHMLWSDDQLATGVFTNFVKWWLNARKNAETKEEEQIAKSLINNFTGVLAKRERRWTKVMPDEKHIIDDDTIIVDELPEIYDGEITCVRYEDRKADELSYSYCPFLYIFITAFGREALNKMIDECGRENLIQAQTDGAIINLPHPPKSLQAKIESGHLKILVEDADVYVQHCNRYCYTRGIERMVGYGKKVEYSDVIKSIVKDGEGTA